MKIINTLAGLFYSLFALTGCTTTLAAGGDGPASGLLASDLRVFLDDSCVPKPQAGFRGFGAVTLGEIGVGLGKYAFNSFGKYLEQAGLPQVTESSGLTSNLFYNQITEETTELTLNPDIQCVHVVRGGFATGPQLPDTNAPYSHLNLTSEPSIYALIRLEGAKDKSAHFRGHLMYFTANRFERVGGTDNRGFGIVLGFSLPQFGAEPHFGIGAIELPNVARRRVFEEQETSGLNTGWMNTPPISDGSEQVAFNLYVDVIETKPGNPLLVGIGRVLQSDPVRRSFDRELTDAVFGDEDDFR